MTLILREELDKRREGLRKRWTYTPNHTHERGRLHAAAVFLIVGGSWEVSQRLRGPGLSREA
jgi:hypothetical protein